MKEEFTEYKSFRDSLSTIDTEGKRKFVYPKKPKGQLHNYRVIFAWLLFAIFFLMPFVKVDGDPFFIFNIIERKFIIFGNIFWPQDTYLFAVMMISFMVFIIVFTVALGRLWCGWACLQTVLMEMLFRKVEYLIDGNAAKERRLKNQNWNFEKLWKRTLKMIVFLILALLISNTLFAWVIGVDEVYSKMQEPIAQNISAFIGMLILTGIILFIYSWFREQVCTILCPYGRLQGVLLDSKSIVVSYDFKRGEPRGVKRKDENREEVGKGDCVDCHQCVDVCPTAIDIRNGTQLECVNCTACIDACDQTMERVGLPKGLIRFDSHHGISTGNKLKLNGRLIAYISVLVVLFSFLVLLFVSRTEIETTILRTPGLIYQEQDNNMISNLYNIKVVNKTKENFSIDVKLLSHKGRVEIVGGSLSVLNSSSVESVLIIYMNKADVKSYVPIKLGIYIDNEEIEEYELTFVGPN